MFLMKLKPRQKELFLNLCLHAVNSNNSFTTVEENAMEVYCDEMNIDFDIHMKAMDLDSILEEIIEISDNSEINIITFEIVALILCDNIYDSLESDFVKKIETTFLIKQDRIELYISLINQYMNVYDEITTAVFEQ